MTVSGSDQHKISGPGKSCCRTCHSWICCDRLWPLQIHRFKTGLAGIARRTWATLNLEVSLPMPLWQGIAACLLCD